MRIAVIVSIIIHIIAITFSYVGFGNLFRDKIKDSGFVVFDFVQIGPKTKAKILSTIEGKASKTKSQTQENETVTQLNQPQESSPPKKEKPKPKEKVEDKKKETKDDDAIALKDKSKKQEPKKKEEAKKKDNKPEKKESQSNSKSPDKAIVNLRKNKKNIQNTDPKSAKKSFNSLLDSTLAKDDNENSGIKAEEVGEDTATLVNLVQQTIRKCWHFPAGLKNAEDLVVEMKMELDPEGTVIKADIVDESRTNSDPDFKIAAENAKRAVLDPECNPLPLPKDRYEEWKEIEMSFNPKDMFN